MESDLKAEFCERLRETNREGIENVIAFLEEKGMAWNWLNVIPRLSNCRILSELCKPRCNR